MVDRIRASLRAVQRAQDKTSVEIAAGDQHRVTRPFPHRGSECRMPGWESSRRTFTVHPDGAEFRVLLELHEVMADLVDEVEGRSEDICKSASDLLVYNEAIDNGKVAARCDRVHILGVMPRF